MVAINFRTRFDDQKHYIRNSLSTSITSSAVNKGICIWLAITNERDDVMKNIANVVRLRVEFFLFRH